MEPSYGLKYKLYKIENKLYIFLEIWWSKNMYNRMKPSYGLKYKSYKIKNKLASNYIFF